MIKIYRNLIILLTVVPTLIPLAGCTTTHEDNQHQLGVGDSLPTFKVETDDGTIYSNETLVGHVAVIFFFYTPCGDCKRELPILNQIYLDYRENNAIRCIGISRAESAVSVSAYWKANDLSMPYSAQNDRSVYELFATSEIPRIYITNRQGVICYAYDDSHLPSYDELVEAINTVLKQT